MKDKFFASKIKIEYFSKDKIIIASAYIAQVQEYIELNSEDIHKRIELFQELMQYR